MGDILKEAIADAKAVRETALENAKMALEEAFTPQIKSMLSAKLKEDEIEESDPVVEDEDMDMDMEKDDEEEVPAEDMEMDDEEEAEEGMREDDDEEAEEAMHDDEMGDDEEVEESNLDLEAIIKELEAELTEDEDEDEDAEEGRGMKESDETVEESDESVEEEYEIDEAALTEEDDEDDKDEVDEELDKSSDIGKGDNNRGSTDASSAIGGGKKGMTEIQAELKEYKEAVHFLKDKLHEVNILNAKLLFTNKLFKQYSLDNNQKLKVVETFDRAQTTREIKLVYSTLAEQFGDNSSIVTKKSISESASSAVSSTKPSPEAKKVISEENNVADRFRKLAGLIK